jgi:CSLREA domain-containing protein
MKSHPVNSRFSKKLSDQQRSWFRGFSLALISLLTLTSGLQEQQGQELSRKAVIPIGDGPLGTTFTVTKTADTNGTCNSGVNCSLREAINAANDETNHPGADTIVFAAGVGGTINLNSALPNISTDINLQGPGANLLEVTRTGSADFPIFTIQRIDSGSKFPTASISGLTITNGHSADTGDLRGFGGGILNVNGTLTVSNCIVSRNTAASAVGISFGGGISNFAATLTVTNSTLSGNSAGGSSGSGGGIGGFNSNVTVTNSTLDGNSATTGGGISGGAVLISNSTISNNIASGDGGGISGGVVLLSHSTISNNIASGKGGGIANGGVAITLRDSTLSGNSASTGGGIYDEGTGNNQANVTVSNCTLSGNSASNGGGVFIEGINGDTAAVSLDNTIIASTNNLPGANLVNGGPNTRIISEGYNLSSDNGGGFLTAVGDQINTNPQLGPLQDNGGPTATMALLPGSPALDKGKNFGVTTDQRGLPRPVDIPSIPNASGGDGSDIGAVEMDPTQTGPTFVVTTTADHDDGVCDLGDCTLREAINVANIAGPNSITFRSGVTGTITRQSTLTVTGSVTINGPGARSLAISGNSAIGVFTFSSGSSAISGLTIRDGAQTGAAGSGSVAGAGGIFNAQNSSLTLFDCIFTGNHGQGADNATAASAGGNGNGGAIANSGVITLNRCTFSTNSAVGGRGGNGSVAIGGNVHGGNGGAGQGGAIFNDTTATLTINDSTFGSNNATGGAGGDGQFGGNGGNGSASVFNLGTMTATAVTLAANVGTGGAAGKGGNAFTGGSGGVGRGGLTAGGGTSFIRNTLSAGNFGNNGGGPDVDGTFTSQGFNLIGIGDSSTGFTGAADQVGTAAAPLNAKLGPLQNNGGPTDTMALLSGSPASDKGKSFGLTTDQRGSGFARTMDDSSIPPATGGDNTDIGAFERQIAPTLQFSSATYSINENAGTATITVTRANDPSLAATVNYATSNGTATAGTDYTATSGTVSFASGDTSKTFTVPIINDTFNEPNETVNLTLSNVTGNATLGTPSTAVLTIIDDDAPVVQFNAPLYVVGEGDQRVTLTVTRSGDTSGTASAGFVTSDSAGSQNCNVFNGIASSRCDYETSIGTVHFAAGETSKTISVLIVDDSYAEGNETFTVSLNNPSGAALGSQSTAAVMIVDNDSVTGPNPIDQTAFFVQVHYYDFLNRQPDPSGLAFWINQITSCGSDQPCIEIKRINVSAAFYLSIEFQQTGYLVERIYKTAYGDGSGASTLNGTHQLSVPIVRLNEFLADTQDIGQGVIVGQTGWEQVLENNKQAFSAEFVQRSRFTTAFPSSMTAAQFVDALNTHAGSPLSQSERDQLVSDLSSSAKTRPQVLRTIAEHQNLVAAESNRAFVLMQYFGYLRRNPNDPQDSDYTGYDFWLTKLNQFNGNFINAEMVKAFITSGEYRQRFGP